MTVLNEHEIKAIIDARIAEIMSGRSNIALPLETEIYRCKAEDELIAFRYEVLAKLEAQT